MRRINAMAAPCGAIPPSPPAEGEDKIHCVAVLRGGYIGEDETVGDVLSDVEEAPAGKSQRDFVRERCLEFIAGTSDDIPTPGVLSFSEVGGIPKVLRLKEP